MSIHETAIVDKKAKIGKNVYVGPFSIIQGRVKIGDNTKIGSNVLIKDFSDIGSNCNIFNGAVIGELPMDLKFEGEKSKMIVGNNTTIREFCTLHRGTKDRGFTKVGSNCLLMSYVHIAHDVIVGDNVIVSISVNIAGHVEIDDFATIGGCTPVHQFCKIGKYAFIGGGRVVLKDVPPYILATGEPIRYAGVNTVGLKRKHFSADTIKKIKRVYSLIYQSKYNLSQAIDQVERKFDLTNNEINIILNFIKKSDRGIV
ncbi:MAG: acyl-[acyl-carrier-protein]--UDP-N-acetylglucosamine O-acyltransferase [Candidatus Marinimicrobia bacterium]|nr:acyl-[acyl-carrier-protein]--UDP-N-acetylglucosamine O-acyltransferase [Candidatus Neomarinimicrobiota bacterium]|tara:strand:+ start:11126 stop:11896 length:771 start_codon:yes stop_codon:yes gene_type:complete